MMQSRLQSSGTRQSSGSNISEFWRIPLRVSLLFVLVQASFVSAAEPPAPKKIVLIAGKKSHGPGAHDYEKTMRLFKVMFDTSNIRESVDVEVHENGWPMDETTLDDADAIIFNSDGRDGDKFVDVPFVKPERMKVIQRQMDRGCGMMTMHFSTFVTDTEGKSVLDWVGGYFDWQDDAGKANWFSKISQVERLEVAKADHPISSGVPRILHVRDEVYWKLRFRPDDKRVTPIIYGLDLKDDANTPLANVVGWATERKDGGRGFGTSVGHSSRLWQDDGVRKLFLNAIAWTAKADIPVGGVEAKFFTSDQVSAALKDITGVQKAKIELPIHVVVLTGNEAHAWHNGEKSTPVVRKLLECDSRIKVNVVSNFEEFAKHDLSNVSAIVLNNFCNWHDPKPPSDGARKAFLEFLSRGGGLVVVHFANGAFHPSLPEAGKSDWPEYRNIVRRVWDHHGKSGHDAFGKFMVEPTDKEHPITSGLKPFEVTDELYFRQAGERPVEPLITAKSKSTGNQEPLAFSYEYSKSRVFQTLLGHSEKTYDAFEAREMLRRAVAWSARRDVVALKPEDEKFKSGGVAENTEPISLVAGHFGKALDAKKGGVIATLKTEQAGPPVSAECWVKLSGKQNFNILLASEPKSSTTHWELYSYSGSGVLSVFMPGRGGEFKSEVDICDDRWHHVAMVLEMERLQLYCDGKQVLDRPITKLADKRSSGEIAIGRLVEGGIGCEGLIDDVRLLSGAAKFDDVPQKPIPKDADAFLHLPFDDISELKKYQASVIRVPRASIASTKGNHWGQEQIGFNWKEDDSRDDRWKEADIGNFLASSLPLSAKSGTVAKGLSIRVGDNREGTLCYDTATMKLRAMWSGGFLKFTPARFGLISSPTIDGTLHFAANEGPAWEAKKTQFVGHHVHGQRVLLDYLVDEVAIRESPWLERTSDALQFRRTFDVAPSERLLVLTLASANPEKPIAIEHASDMAFARVAGESGQLAIAVHGSAGKLRVNEDGQLQVEIAPRRKHAALCIIMQPLSGDNAIVQFKRSLGDERTIEDVARFTKPGPPRWTEEIVTRGQVSSDDGAYVVDTLTIPFDNPYRALFFTSGHDFLPDHSAVVCTVHGDVWRVSGIDERLERLNWKRFATGLFQPLGIVTKGNDVYVLGRDQITRLRDENNDGEADYYECFTNAFPTSPGGHDYTTCLETDADGNFYFITANEGVWRISSDGKISTNIAGGLRNPNGLGVGPGPIITAAPQEGNWTPASYIAVVRPGDWFGYNGPKVSADRPLGYTLPLCYIPRRRDNSSGGQVWVDDSRWGPLSGQMLHLSYGQCSVMSVLRETIDGQVQGGTIDLAPTFASGAMRGRKNEHDGQLYVTGLRGWTTSATQDGCLQRVRYTGKSVAFPIEWKTYANGVSITFNAPLKRESAEQIDNFFAEQWNYVHSANYGSPDFKVSNPKEEGHDEVRIASATLLSDERTVFLEIDSLRPVNQLSIGFALDPVQGVKARHTIAYTLHKVPSEKFQGEELHQTQDRLSSAQEAKLKSGLILRQNNRSTVVRMAAVATEQQLDVAFEGYLKVPLSGEFNFRGIGQGEATVFLNEQQVWQGRGDLSQSPSLAARLRGGYNSLRIKYCSTDGEATSFRLLWSCESFGEEQLPPTALFHPSSDKQLVHDESLANGERLFANHHCGKCHQGSLPAAAETIHEPPSLEGKARFQSEWLANWLLDPGNLRNDVHMPAMFDPAKPSDQSQVADLMAYLQLHSPGEEPPTDEPSVESGRERFEKLGCIACHRTTPPDKPDEFARVSLHYLRAKYTNTSLREYLASPHRHHPTSRMPDFKLSAAETNDLTASLLEAATDKLPLFRLPPGDAAKGRDAFAKLGCASCHQTPRGEPLKSVPARKLATDRLDQGCLAEQPVPGIPRVQLTSDEKQTVAEYLREALKSQGHRVLPFRSTALIRELRCHACHDRDLARSPRLEILDQESDDGRAPELFPNLTWSGEKLQTSWLERQIAGKLAYQSRPWLKARMPAFPAYAKTLALDFAEQHGLRPTDDEPAAHDHARIAAGEALVRKEALDCQQCHAVGANEPTGDEKSRLAPGINFAHVRERLRYDYYLRFALDPPRLDVSSRMPKLSLDGKTTKVAEFYDGDARRQFDAVWQYIQSVKSGGNQKP